MYITVNQQLERLNFFKDKDKTVHFISGAAAGCVATVTTFPLDIIRTRLVAQSSRNKAYNGTIHSFKRVYFFNSVFSTYNLTTT